MDIKLFRSYHLHYFYFNFRTKIDLLSRCSPYFLVCLLSSITQITGGHKMIFSIENRGNKKRRRRWGWLSFARLFSFPCLKEPNDINNVLHINDCQAYANIIFMTNSFDLPLGIIYLIYIDIFFRIFDDNFLSNIQHCSTFLCTMSN